jgi:hypothetical protein
MKRLATGFKSTNDRYIQLSIVVLMSIGIILSITLL